VLALSVALFLGTGCIFTIALGSSSASALAMPGIFAAHLFEFGHIFG
jgi:hypothetical protein